MTRVVQTMTASRKRWSNGTVVGVTGHRLLPDENKIIDAIDLALDRIDGTYGRRPLIVLSPLASGADQLVARRALVRPGADLVATLPMPLVEYLDDFPAGTKRDAFLRLLDQAAETVSLPRADSRLVSYEAVGHYVVEHSDVLIAIWDGKPARGRGGTAEVVALARRRKLPLVWIQAANRSGPNRAPQATDGEQVFVHYERFPLDSLDT